MVWLLINAAVMCDVCCVMRDACMCAVCCVMRDA